MKSSKKILSLVLALLMCTCVFVITPLADSPDSYTYKNGDTEIVIQGENLTDQKVQSIITHFTGEEQLISEEQVTGEEYASVDSFNILCTLYGHLYETHHASITTYDYYEDFPTDLIEHYTIYICTRCGYERYVLESFERACCH